MGKSRDANRELDLVIARRAETTDITRILAEEGITTISLDAKGNMVEHRPDGTTRLASAPPQDTETGAE